MFDSFKSEATLLFSHQIDTAWIEQDFPADNLTARRLRVQFVATSVQ